MHKANATSIGWACAALLLLAPGAAAAHAEAHPQDGPHLDLRIEIAREALRFETIVNLAFADEQVGSLRENLDTIHAVEYEALERALLERFLARTLIEVDGERPRAEATRFEVYDPDPSLVALFPTYGARALTQVRLHWEYALAQPAEEVEILWGAYPDDTAERRLGAGGPREVLARLSAAGIQSVITLREGDEPFRWSASGAALDHLLPVPAYEPGESRRLPLLSILLAGGALVVILLRPLGSTTQRALAATALFVVAFVARDTGHLTLDAGNALDETQALAVFEPLHANVYRAFDYSDEEDVYDALARCVEGDLLERLYGEIYASLVQEEAGGAVGNVQSLTPVSTRVTDIVGAGDGPRFDVSARWQVEGAVFHWGHAHWRVQEIAANYGVRATPEGWRLQTSEVLEQILVSATQERPGEDGPAPFEIPEEL